MKKQNKITYRDIDLRYISNSTPESNPQYFDFVVSHSSQFLSSKKKLNILEIGCACGDFLGILNKDFPHHEFTGLDINKSLIEEASLRYPSISFLNKDFLSLREFKFNKYDIVYSLTVHSLFDDIYYFLMKIYNILNSQGIGIIFGLFNPNPIDVYIKAYHTSKPKIQVPGWNFISRKSLSNFLEKNKIKYKFITYEQQSIKNSDDNNEFSSWTQELKDGSFQIINGLGLIHHFELLTIYKG